MKLYNDFKLLFSYEWLAERRLADELLKRLEVLLNERNLSWDDISGIIVFRGPGSFTGLRIGMTVMNTIAYVKSVPIIGEIGDDWEEKALFRLNNKENEKIVLPHYGADANITLPKK
jgi:tRNA threonylcarbamoyladenosine biosynthesis protein TsaB